MIIESKKINNITNIIFYIIIGVIILLGIYFRLGLYLSKIPIWLNEAMLSLSFIDRDFFGMFVPLEANQKTPPLFCALTLLIVKIFGFRELSFRLIPFICGNLSLFVFFIFLKNYLKSKISIILGLFIFAANYLLIYYSNEFKPYSSDVFICLLLLLCYKKIHLQGISVKKVILYTIISVLLVLFSFPCMFIIPAMLITKFIEEKHITYKALFIPLGIVFICIYYCFIYSYLYQEEILELEWQTGFLKLSFSSFYNMFNELFTAIINNFNPIFLKYILLIMLSGLILLYFEKKIYALLITNIFLIAAAASMLKVYPMTERMVLYLFPIIIFLIVKVTDIIKTDKIIIKIPLVILQLLLIAAIIYMLNLYYHYTPVSFISRMPYNDRLNIKNGCIKVLQNYSIENDEKILLPHDFVTYIKFYNKKYNLNNIKKDNFVSITDDNPDKIFSDYLKNNKNINLWVLGKQDAMIIKCPDKEYIEKSLKNEKRKFIKTFYGDVYVYYIFMI